MPPKMKTVFQLDSPFADPPWPQINAQDQDTITELLANLLSPIGLHRKTHTTSSQGKRSKKRKHAAAGDEQKITSSDSIPHPPIASQTLVGLNSVTRHLSSSCVTSCPSTFLPTTSAFALNRHNPELTLIVAATDKGMGIGNNGGLPWTGLKKEMAYFARVTKRAPSSQSSATPLRNVVIMGRKTWESIPAKFRPLPGRLNIVLSRSHPEMAEKQLDEYTNEPLKVASLEGALAALQGRDFGKVFVIGGAELYKAALGLPNTTRILLTRILSEFECDTKFPITLSTSNPSTTFTGWEKRSQGDLNAWTAEEVPGTEQEENGTKYVYEMWEKDTTPPAHMSILFTTRQPTPPLTSYLPMLAYTASLAHPDKEATRLVVLPLSAEKKICEALGIARAGFVGLLEGDAMGTNALVEFVREKVPMVEPGKWLEEGVKEYRETRINSVLVPAPVPQAQKKK